MSKKDEIPNWLLWLVEHCGLAIIVALALLVVAFGGAYYVDNRLDGIESRLNDTPPRSYVPPNLDDYDAGGKTVSELTNRHLVYVPVYSHIYYQGGRPYPLETTLSIRNVDPVVPIYIESVQYYNTLGKLAKTDVDRLIKLDSLETVEFLVEQRNSVGGSGANFLVRWSSDPGANPPMIETVMVGTSASQGISFARSGVEITNSAHSAAPESNQQQLQAR